ncbi:hypothetical protein H8356DRAFT_1007859 [Neocallimastix lanati (nom. inval.)]|jgi:reverse gyrase|nr:hypothetical protein H8356DRAFT_1007859 [Neocallimastix sp. JGI-2020a]
MELSLLLFLIFIVFVLISAVIWIACCNTCCGKILIANMAEKIPCLKCFVQEDMNEYYSYEQVAYQLQEV